MKAIMISGKPKWSALIMNGDKTKEIRRNKALANAIQKLIDEYGYAEIYWYCSKDTKNLLHKNCADIYWIEDKDFRNKNKQLGLQNLPTLNGKVLFKFRCYKVEEIPSCQFSVYYFPYTETLDDYDLLDKSCLTKEEIDDYLGYDKEGYAIHISDLEIFDKPKELSEFRYAVCPKTNCEYCEYNKTVEGDLYCTRKTLTKAPQSMCYIETEN